MNGNHTGQKYCGKRETLIDLTVEKSVEKKGESPNLYYDIKVKSAVTMCEL